MSKKKGREFKQTLSNEYIDKNYYGKYLPMVEALKAKGEQVNILPREWYAVELQELKYGHLAKSEAEFARQKKNPKNILFPYRL